MDIELNVEGDINRLQIFRSPGRKTNIESAIAMDRYDAWF